MPLQHTIVSICIWKKDVSENEQSNSPAKRNLHTTDAGARCKNFNAWSKDRKWYLVLCKMFPVALMMVWRTEKHFAQHWVSLSLLSSCIKNSLILHSGVQISFCWTTLWSFTHPPGHKRKGATPAWKMEDEQWNEMKCYNCPIERENNFMYGLTKEAMDGLNTKPPCGSIMSICFWPKRVALDKKVYKTNCWVQSCVCNIT